MCIFISEDILNKNKHNINIPEGHTIVSSICCDLIRIVFHKVGLSVDYLGCGYISSLGVHCYPISWVVSFCVSETHNQAFASYLLTK